MNLIDSVNIADGGTFGKGYIHGIKKINPDDFYWGCHFNSTRDEVVPGSLGVETMRQLLEIYSIERGICTGSYQFLHTSGTMKSKYRGQITLRNKISEYELSIENITTTNDILPCWGSIQFSIVCITFPTRLGPKNPCL